MKHDYRLRARATLASPGVKALIVSFLVLVFLIPLSLVRQIVDDRRSNRDRAVESIIEPVGGRPRIFGPYVLVPYERWRKGEIDARGEVIILADELSIESSLSIETRKRGLFSSPVIGADVEIRGVLGAQGSAAAVEAAPSGANILWDKARLVLEMPDLRSLREALRIQWNGTNLALQPDASKGKAYAQSLSTRVGYAAGVACSFLATLPLRGGPALYFLEPAGTVRASMRGDWPSPSFRGYVSPTDRELTKGGFSARWYLAESSQGLPRAFDASDMAEGWIAKAAFGVELLGGVDAYDASRRAVRYGILFIIMPFAALFLFELLSRSRVHPVQYVLIGLADCVFYLLLLSLSEIVGFGWAYALAAASCALLAGAYAAASLRSRLGLLMMPALALLYAYLYVALRSEDYALLIGSLGMLALLAAAMAATRNIDWYGRPSSKADIEEAAP
jgi:inner membrane protein